MSVKKSESQASFDAMYMADVFSDALIKVQNKYKLDVQAFLTTCFSTPFIYNTYFSYGMERSWWFDEYAIEDILTRYNMLGITPKPASVIYSEDSLHWIGYVVGYWFSMYPSQTPDVILPFLDIKRLDSMYPECCKLNMQDAISCIRGD